ncbi:hypothetical protein LR48_Vigan04g108100 [Vigna angularis]|uniref:Uncharacterized protein n=1 Tax=Phaseolus angularis TaxID=3914 RepID=A0A0L9UDQ2_PHAAN|nr:hypothetical protein LR48_Vigan04g108100 [Vigna angularis]
MAAQKGNVAKQIVQASTEALKTTFKSKAKKIPEKVAAAVLIQAETPSKENSTLFIPAPFFSSIVALHVYFLSPALLSSRWRLVSSNERAPALHPFFAGSKASLWCQVVGRATASAGRSTPKLLSKVLSHGPLFSVMKLLSLLDVEPFTCAPFQNESHFLPAS